MADPASVLFVCLGNICRSPMAEGAFRAACGAAGVQIKADSCGTAGYHIGEPPDPRAIANAAQHNVDISTLRGRQLSKDDYTNFTHICALDESNLADIKARAPANATAQIALLMDYAAGEEGTPVPDPYYGGEEGFEDVWQMVTRACEGLIAELRNHQP